MYSTMTVHFNIYSATRCSDGEWYLYRYGRYIGRAVTCRHDAVAEMRRLHAREIHAGHSGR